MFFDSWTGIARVLIVGTLAYAATVILLRVSGKRTLSKMNAFDFIVTIAIGSTLATTLLSKTVAYVEGVVAIALLIFLQFAITWLSVRIAWLQRLFKAQPTLLFYQGEFLQPALRSERVTEEEIQASIRSSGLASMRDVQAVVLETDGSIAVIKTGIANASALSEVEGWTGRGLRVDR